MIGTESHNIRNTKMLNNNNLNDNLLCNIYYYIKTCFIEIS